MFRTSQLQTSLQPGVLPPTTGYQPYNPPGWYETKCQPQIQMRRARMPPRCGGLSAEQCCILWLFRCNLGRVLSRIISSWARQKLSVTSLVQISMRWPKSLSRIISRRARQKLSVTRLVQIHTRRSKIQYRKTLKNDVCRSGFIVHL